MGNPFASSSKCCLTIQQMLDDIVGQNAPNTKVLETYGFLNSVRSDANMRGVDMIATKSAQGKARPTAVSNRKVEIEYTVRQCNSVATSPTSVCTDGPASTDDKLYEDAYVTLYAESKFNLSKTEFRDLCEGANMRRQREIVNRINDLKKHINEQLVTAFIAGLGNYFTEAGGVPVDSATTPKTLNLFNPNTNNGLAPNALAFLPLLRDFQRSQWMGTPIVVGGTSLQQWGNVATGGAFRGNVEGLDPAAMPQLAIFPDYQVDLVFADTFEHILSYAPGTVHMLEWDANVGEYEEFFDDFSRTTIEVDGMTFDLDVSYDKCDQEWTIKISKYYDLWKVPADAFNTACDQYSNGCLNWLVDCAALDCNYVKL